MRVGRAGRRAPHAERAVMAHSSPEPAARWFGGGLWGEAGRRAPHAERAVMAHSSPEPAAGEEDLRFEMGLWGEAWVVPGQRAGSGKVAAGFRSPRAFGQLVRRGAREVRSEKFEWRVGRRPSWGSARPWAWSERGLKRRREGRLVGRGLVTWKR